MRMRLFPLSTHTNNTNSTTNSTTGLAAAAAAAAGASAMPAVCDWVGFDGAVKQVAWSAKGRWVAALGGSSLLVTSPSPHPPSSAPSSTSPSSPASTSASLAVAETPLLCVTSGWWQDSSGEGKSEGESRCGVGEGGC